MVFSHYLPLPSPPRQLSRRALLFKNNVITMNRRVPARGHLEVEVVLELKSLQYIDMYLGDST